MDAEWELNGESFRETRGLWDDWQSKVRLTKGELRHKYPGEFRKVIHQGDWIEEIRRALKDR